MNTSVAEVQWSEDEATDKLLTEFQAQQTIPEVKVTKCYLFDAKRWAEWCVWGIMVTAFACIVGWASHLYGLNQSLESQALRYRAIRMDLGQRHPKIAELDSLFSAEDPDASIRKLRKQVLAYEATLLCHAELQLKQQQLTKEQEDLLRQLQQ